MKKLIFVLLLLPSFLLLGQKKAKVKNLCAANNCPASMSLNFSTGINPNTGEVLPVGSIDPAWQLLNYPPLEGTTVYDVNIPDAHVISPYEGSSTWNAISEAGILSSIDNSGLSDNNVIGNQPWRFRRSFCVCDDSRFRISGIMRADDQGSINLYNSEGELLFSQATVDEAHGSDVVFNIDLSLPIGSYYIEFHLRNNWGRATGFSVFGTITNLSNQVTLLNGSVFCCANTGFITVQKILETKNCNGQFDQTDEAGEGWTFNLQNESGEVIQTQTTNEFGETVFNGLSAGTYTVNEVEQSGWYPSVSESGTQQVILSANEGTSLTFFNCKGTRPFCCSGENLIANGSFDDGNSGFSNEFLFHSITSLSSIGPGQYGVLNGSQAGIISPTWDIEAASPCIEASGNFLIVNGENGGGNFPPDLSNTIPPTKIIWEQTIDIEDWKGYKFCMKVKNLDQCGFNVTPKIEVQFSMLFGDITEVISVSSNECEWQEISKSLDLWGYGNSLTIKIILDQNEFGDGNDIAIDDISLIQLERCPVESAVFDFNTITPHPTVSGAIGISATADIVPPCEFVWWEICEIEMSTGNCKPNTKLNGVWWDVTTNFFGYTGTNIQGDTDVAGIFKAGKLYKITRGTWGECNSWISSSKYGGLPPQSRTMKSYTEVEFKAKRQVIMRTFAQKKKKKN